MSNETSYKCHVCEKDFTMAISNAGYPGGKDREIINCHWDDAKNSTEVTSGITTTHKELTEDGVAK